MIDAYSIYLDAEVNIAKNKGKWATATYPDGRAWVVEFWGEAGHANIRRLYLVGALKALTDLEIPCDVTLHCANADALDLISQVAMGLTPRIGTGALVQKLENELVRHKSVILKDVSLSDPRMLTLRETMNQRRK